MAQRRYGRRSIVIFLLILLITCTKDPGCLLSRRWLAGLCSRARARHGLSGDNDVGCCGKEITNKQLQITPVHGHMTSISGHVSTRQPSAMLNVRVRLRTFHQHLLARRYHQRFNILYFGRDEFSCRVFEKLYNATGRSSCFFLAPMFC